MRKLICCALFFVFTSDCTVSAQVVEDDYVSADKEIDNYDFLYDGSEGFDYDVSQIESLMDEAMSHLGTPYRYGSKGPTTFDCSGFTSYVYRKQLNTNIGGDSRDQYRRNVPVSRDQLQRGDLVFFTSPRSGKAVGHVGIVVDVDPVTDAFTFIHASTKQGVKISKSTEAYYSRRYIGARRVE